eukprot:scaffold8542_cov119-Isochrysis_galbana.AAC.8
MAGVGLRCSSHSLVQQLEMERTIVEHLLVMEVQQLESLQAPTNRGAGGHACPRTSRAPIESETAADCRKLEVNLLRMRCAACHEAASRRALMLLRVLTLPSA